MAITQYVINGDVTALKAALEATGFFASLAYDDDENPKHILCYDSEQNLLFDIGAWLATDNNNYWGYKAYRSDGTNYEYSGSGVKNSNNNYGVPTYLYKVGSKAAVIHFQNSASHAAFLVIAKTSSGSIGFVGASDYLVNSSGNGEMTNLMVVSWDDDPALTTRLCVSSSPNASPMIGNATLLVPVPLHGTYGNPLNFETVFFIPMSQAGLRGVVQEIVGSNNKTYLTNGYLAVLDV